MRESSLTTEVVRLAEFRAAEDAVLNYCIRLFKAVYQECLQNCANWQDVDELARFMGKEGQVLGATLTEMVRQVAASRSLHWEGQVEAPGPAR